MSSHSGAIVITGATGGIGSVIAEVFVGAGRKIVAVGRSEAKVQKIAGKLGCRGYVADVLDAAAVDELYRDVSRNEGLAGLIHCVGGFSMQPFWEADSDTFERMFGMNARSLFLNARAITPHLIEAGSGIIVGISSELAWSGEGPGSAVYAASKSAATVLLRSLDLELSPHGVRSSIIYPMAVVDTPPNRAAMPDADPGTWVNPRDIAAILLRATSCTGEGHLREIPIWPTSRSVVEVP